MVGIVVASHSTRLAEAAVDLALEMVAGDRPPIAIAAGAGEDVIGTDAARIAEGIAAVASQSGVLVLMDLGSAILSAEMALELLEDQSTTVRLSAAPFVEGLLAAVVVAATGASLDEVERAAASSLEAKTSQLADPGPAGRLPSDGEQDPDGTPEPPAPAAPDANADVVLVNRNGLHARPVAAVVAAVASHDALVTLTNLRTGTGPVSAASPTALATLAARAADTVRVEGRGPHARAAVDAVRTLVESGFGEERADVGSADPEDGALGVLARQEPQEQRPGQSPRPEPEVGARPVGVSPGRVVGPALLVPAGLTEPDPTVVLPASDRPAAAGRCDAAAAAVESDLRERASHLTAEGRDILDAIASMARDPALASAIRTGVIDRGRTPERAVWEAVAQVSAVFASGGPLLAARVVDLHAVRDRMIARLTGRPAPEVPELTTPSVLVAQELAPTEVAVLDPARCLAIVTLDGGPTSHTAILARSLGIPAVVGATEAMTVSDGQMMLVDGTTGEVVLDPG